MFEQWVAMEGRGRVGQSLRLKRRASSGLWARSYDWRWLRSVRRWTSALVNLNVQRGAGSSAAALLLLASVGYGVVRGGHEAQIAENVQDLCDAADSLPECERLALLDLDTQPIRI
jgi:hypothetical protein